MKELNSKNFDEEIAKGITAVDFWASWCAPCMTFSPIFEGAEKEYKSIKFCKLNVDENSGIANKYEVMSIPTLIIFKNGKEITRSVGLLSKEQLKKFLEKAK